MRKEGTKEEEKRTRIERKEEGRKGRKKDTKKRIEGSRKERDLKVGIRFNERRAGIYRKEKISNKSRQKEKTRRQKTQHAARRCHVRK